METKIIKSSYLEKTVFVPSKTVNAKTSCLEADLKSNIGIAEMSLDQVFKILDEQLANDYALFTKALHPRFGSCSTSLLGGGHYD
jgi:hypothetical protein